MKWKIQCNIILNSKDLTINRNSKRSSIAVQQMWLKIKMSTCIIQTASLTTIWDPALFRMSHQMAHVLNILSQALPPEKN